MNDNFPPPWNGFGKEHSFYVPHEGRIDFYRAYCDREKKETEGAGRAPTKQADATIRAIDRLIKEYCATAERVGERLDYELLLGIIEALQFESKGDTKPLDRLSLENPIRRFLAESLYYELLDVPLDTLKPKKEYGLEILAPEDWRLCLDRVGRSLVRKTIPN